MRRHRSEVVMNVVSQTACRMQQATVIAIDGETLTVEPLSNEGEGRYVYADALNHLNRTASFEVHTEDHVCIYAGAAGVDPALNMGLRLDDVELFQRPYDPLVAVRDQYVPSQGPGLYFWVDNKLVYNHVDASTAGPDASEPPWIPSPLVLIGTLATDPGWDESVIHDTGICRLIASDGEPAVGATVPEPAILAVL